MLKDAETATQPQLAAIKTEAEFVFTTASRAPQVYLSFDGSSAPTEIFAELDALGWTVPMVPPPPRDAIEWHPDPSTGQDYTITSWKVEEFLLGASKSWSKSDEAEVGRRTINCLRSHGAAIAGIRGQVTDSDPESRAATADRAPESDTQVSNTIIVVQPLTASWIWPDGFTSEVATRSGESGGKWMWSEGSEVESTANISRNADRALVFSVDEDTRTSPGPKMKTIQVLSMDAEVVPEIVRWMSESLDVPVTNYALTPLGHSEQGHLLTASVHAHSTATVKAAVASSFSDVIVHVPA